MMIEFLPVVLLLLAWFAYKKAWTGDKQGWVVTFIISLTYGLGTGMAVVLSKLNIF